MVHVGCKSKGRTETLHRASEDSSRHKDKALYRRMAWSFKTIEKSTSQNKSDNRTRVLHVGLLSGVSKVEAESATKPIHKATCTKDNGSKSE